MNPNDPSTQAPGEVLLLETPDWNATEEGSPTMKRLGVSVAILVLVSAPARAVETPHESLACMARNEPQGSLVQTITLRSIDRVGSESLSKATLYWRKQGDRSDLLMRFFDPPDMSGAALLIEERGSGQPSTMHLYVPALGRARRVSARGSTGPVLGTNFSFEDFEHLYGIAH